VLLVVVAHYAETVFLTGWLSAARFIEQRAAVVALDVFFVLSGFLITGILIDTKGSGSYFRTFYARRCLRIIPLYYGFLILYFGALPVAAPNTFGSLALSPSQHFFYWSYLANIPYGLGWPIGANTGHVWSLAVEEQFYVIWPAVVYFSGPARLRTIVLGCLPVAALARLLLLAQLPDTLAFHTFTVARMDGLALGALVALSVRRPGGLTQVRRWAAPAAIVGGTVFTAVVVFEQGMTSHQIGLHDAVLLTASPYLAGAAVCAAITTHGTGFWHRLFTRWTVRQIGQYSYAIYLLHPPIAYVMDRLGWRPPQTPEAGVGPSLAYVAGLIGVTIAISAISWHGFEQRFLRLKRALPYEFRDRQDGARSPTGTAATPEP
jgi:peptidoglycan/LPS O-acetylase OafA/YrhL